MKKIVYAILIAFMFVIPTRGQEATPVNEEYTVLTPDEALLLENYIRVENELAEAISLKDHYKEMAKMAEEKAFLADIDKSNYASLVDDYQNLVRDTSASNDTLKVIIASANETLRNERESFQEVAENYETIIHVKEIELRETAVRINFLESKMNQTMTIIIGMVLVIVVCFIFYLIQMNSIYKKVLPLIMNKPTPTVEEPTETKDNVVPFKAPVEETVEESPAPEETPEPKEEEAVEEKTETPKKKRSKFAQWIGIRKYKRAVSKRLAQMKKADKKAKKLEARRAKELTAKPTDTPAISDEAKNAWFATTDKFKNFVRAIWTTKPSQETATPAEEPKTEPKPEDKKKSTTKPRTTKSSTKGKGGTKSGTKNSSTTKNKSNKAKTTK